MIYFFVHIILCRPNLKDAVKSLKDLGADIVVTDDFIKSAEVKQIIADLPAPRLGLNCVGGEIATDLSRLIGENGVVVTYGAMSKKPLTISNSSLIFKNISYRGFWLSRYASKASASERQKLVDELADLVRSKKLTLALEKKQFAELHDVLAHVYDGFKDKKVVLTF